MRLAGAFSPGFFGTLVFQHFCPQQPCLTNVETSVVCGKLCAEVAVDLFNEALAVVAGNNEMTGMALSVSHVAYKRCEDEWRSLKCGVIKVL